MGNVAGLTGTAQRWLEATVGDGGGGEGAKQGMARRVNGGGGNPREWVGGKERGERRWRGQGRLTAARCGWGEGCADVDGLSTRTVGRGISIWSKDITSAG